MAAHPHLAVQCTSNHKLADNQQKQDVKKSQELMLITTVDTAERGSTITAVSAAQD